MSEIQIPKQWTEPYEKAIYLDGFNAGITYMRKEAEKILIK